LEQRLPDRKADLATYCLVRSGGPTHYGGLVAHALEGCLLELTLSTEAADVLGLPERVELNVRRDDAERAERWFARFPA
jgi:hypothetical protein